MFSILLSKMKTYCACGSGDIGIAREKVVRIGKARRGVSGRRIVIFDIVNIIC